MIAAVLEKINEKVIIKDVDLPELNQNEVLVRVSHAALNHRDVWIQKGQYAGIRTPIILGADGSGVVVKSGSEENAHWINQEVIVNPGMNWGENARVQAKDYVILGTPDDGTFAEYVKVPAKLLYNKPSHLNFSQAAALPLAGLTAYRATMIRAKVKQGENVLITGIGGGVALFCMQFAIAAGCNVYVTSGDDDKIIKAIAMGAIAGCNYKNDDWEKQLKNKSGGFDAIIDSSGGSTFAKLVDIAKPAARIVMYGATLGNFDSGVPAKIFWKQLDIMGSTMGSDLEFKEMVSFVNQNHIVPIVDCVYHLAQIQEALNLLQTGKQFGKIVLQIQP
jgi:NADPH:quinone reductase-like Zn-dependent oxidoreductase